jgi:hypothetical protein
MWSRNSIYMENSCFVNESNEKNFIKAWNDIKKFYEPRTSTILADIYCRIYSIKHQPGQCIQQHLMMLDDQFARFHEIGKAIKE